jgi:hypothetical protein
MKMKINFVKSQSVKFIQIKKCFKKSIRQQSIYQQQTDFEKLKFSFRKKR